MFKAFTYNKSSHEEAFVTISSSRQEALDLFAARTDGKETCFLYELDAKGKIISNGMEMFPPTAAK